MVNVWPLSYGSVMELTSVCDGVYSFLRNIDNREGLHLKHVTCKYNTCKRCLCIIEPSGFLSVTPIVLFN